MKNNNDQYFEILLEPYELQEIFLDFISCNIQPCIEEVQTPYHLDGYHCDLSSFDFMRFFPQEEQKYSQFIIRTLKDPNLILDELVEYAGLLSSRLDMKVDFGFGYRVCQNKDWIEAYKQSVLPVCVGGFYIRPSWHPKSQNMDLKDLMIDPALAFGSGHHATTSMCLELLEEMDLEKKRLLDVGCGSGILSIAATMLGANVEICDTDSLAIEESLKNFKLNHQPSPISWVGSIALAQNTYDVIVANILASILGMLKGDFDRKLRENGTLILSGILEEYKEEILRRFADYEVVKILAKGEWIALKLVKLK
ncbi:50S ribosomal protein L11 methyltransferase [Helicobacter pametensis]|uniref:50S ribosomal protein L11 methyltransferase n=1 Tax=Helicobacter pametensis TaxID=95149 RepID=UPI000485109E|nr:50S ribosomal protein L11 methyltransferase [Helicobacter pametensis]